MGGGSHFSAFVPADKGHSPRCAPPTSSPTQGVAYPAARQPIKNSEAGPLILIFYRICGVADHEVARTRPAVSVLGLYCRARECADFASPRLHRSEMHQSRT